MNANATGRHVILLVEDDRLALLTLSQGLAGAGHTVAAAESAEEAEEYLAGGERPDLAILDVHLPGRSGLELAARLQTLERVPFMLLTAFDDEAIVNQAAEIGALGYLVKPIAIQQLLPAISAAVSRANEIGTLRASRLQLQEALDNEREISVAVGIAMVQYRLGRKAAFELLRKTARSQNKKLTTLAAEVVSACEVLNLGSGAPID